MVTGVFYRGATKAYFACGRGHYLGAFLCLSCKDGSPFLIKSEKKYLKYKSGTEDRDPSRVLCLSATSLNIAITTRNGTKIEERVNR